MWQMHYTSIPVHAVVYRQSAAPPACCCRQVYPESTNSRGSYRDSAIADAITSYNRQVVAALGGASVGGGASAGSVPAAGR
jgi:hypothetical protein